MKYLFDLEDGTYILIGRDGALHFDTSSDQGIKISAEGLGTICKLEEYKEEAKMIKDCCVRISSYEEAEKVLDKLEKMYPDMLWDNGYKPTAFIPIYNSFYIVIQNGELSYSGRPVLAINDEFTFDEFMVHLDGTHNWTKANTDAFKKALDMVNQSAKADAGKPKLTLVPQQIIYDIAEVREYGNEKYGDPDNWRTVEPERYRDAAFRHFLKYLSDPYGVDEESGISNLKHLACNIAFLCELEKEEINGHRKTM